VLGAVLVIAGGTAAPRWGAEFALGTMPAQWIGKWSYGMYLWQIPILVMVSHIWSHDWQVPLWARFAFIVLTVSIAALSFFYFESPIRRWRALTSRPWRTLGVALVVTLLGLLAVSILCT
jgi:peptidoglycan/LPS O-acetylase OafA/YrhL